MKSIDAKILAMYLGCECHHASRGDEVYLLHSVDLAWDDSGPGVMITNKESGVDALPDYCHYTSVRPLLRRLEDMTPAEGKKVAQLQSDVYKNITFQNTDGSWLYFTAEYASSSRRRTHIVKFYQLSPDQFAYLLSQRFDLFNLLDQNLAHKVK